MNTSGFKWFAGKQIAVVGIVVAVLLALANNAVAELCIGSAVVVVGILVSMIHCAMYIDRQAENVNVNDDRKE